MKTAKALGLSGVEMLSAGLDLTVSLAGTAQRLTLHSDTGEEVGVLQLSLK